MKVRILILGFAIWAALGFGTSTSAQTILQGVVFEDENTNGVREQGERGIAGVVVSNQVDCVATGEDGSYEIDGDNGFGVVFVSVPATHRAVGRFWAPMPADADKGSIDFALTAAPIVEEFTFIHASDPHLSEETLPQLRRLREIVEERKPAFVLMTGDLVEDALRVPEEVARGYYELYRREIEAFPVPVYSVPGNHEIFGIERHRSLVGEDHPLYGKKMYRHYLGPDYYSFQYGRVRFVALDSLDYSDLWYYGRVDETQLEWMDRDAALMPQGSSVVIFAHMPPFTSLPLVSPRGLIETQFIDVDGVRTYRNSVSNARQLMEHVSRFDCSLVLAGHIHYREKLQMEEVGATMRFYQAPAVRDGSPAILYRVQGRIIDDGELIPLGN
jgi:Icc-related predicted phosphoesterase